MNRRIRLIAFDLDGTLLDGRKALPEANRRELARLGAAGTLLVPATGRVAAGLPEALRALPGLRWAILANGAEVRDLETGAVLAREEIPLDTALELLELAESLRLPCDCYQDGRGYMTRSLYERAPEYLRDPAVLELVLRLRTPVDELRAFLRERGESVQKLQLYFTDPALRERLLRELPERFPALSVTSSIPVNIEINSERANKGEALARLCAALGVDPAETLAFGDGTNDLSLLRAAGIGVAMGNAAPELKAAASLVTSTNDDAGVAAVLRAL